MEIQKKLEEAERRRAELDQVRRQLEAEKSRRENQTEDKRQIVKENHEKIVQERVNKYLEKIEQSDLKVAKARAKLEHSVLVKANMDYMRELDRLENVRRIQEMQKYQKQRLLEKIEADNQRSRQIRQEHENLYRMRLKIKEEMEERKFQLLNEFQKKKRKAFRADDKSNLEVSRKNI